MNKKTKKTAALALVGALLVSQISTTTAFAVPSSVELGTQVGLPDFRVGIGGFDTQHITESAYKEDHNKGSSNVGSLTPRGDAYGFNPDGWDWASWVNGDSWKDPVNNQGKMGNPDNPGGTPDALGNPQRGHADIERMMPNDIPNTKAGLERMIGEMRDPGKPTGVMSIEDYLALIGDQNTAIRQKYEERKANAIASQNDDAKKAKDVYDAYKDAVNGKDPYGNTGGRGNRKTLQDWKDEYDRAKREYEKRAAQEGYDTPENARNNAETGNEKPIEIPTKYMALMRYVALLQQEQMAKNDEWSKMNLATVDPNHANNVQYVYGGKVIGADGKPTKSAAEAIGQDSDKYMYFYVDEKGNVCSMTKSDILRRNSTLASAERNGMKNLQSAADVLAKYGGDVEKLPQEYKTAFKLSGIVMKDDNGKLVTIGQALSKSKNGYEGLSESMKEKVDSNPYVHAQLGKMYGEEETLADVTSLAMSNFKDTGLLDEFKTFGMPTYEEGSAEVSSMLGQMSNDPTYQDALREAQQNGFNISGGALGGTLASLLGDDGSVAEAIDAMNGITGTNSQSSADAAKGSAPKSDNYIGGDEISAAPKSQLDLEQEYEANQDDPSKADEKTNQQNVRETLESLRNDPEAYLNKALESLAKTAETQRNARGLADESTLDEEFTCRYNAPGSNQDPLNNQFQNDIWATFGNYDDLPAMLKQRLSKTEYERLYEKSCREGILFSDANFTTGRKATEIGSTKHEKDYTPSDSWYICPECGGCYNDRVSCGCGVINSGQWRETLAATVRSGPFAGLLNLITPTGSDKLNRFYKSLFGDKRQTAIQALNPHASEEDKGYAWWHYVPLVTDGAQGNVAFGKKALDKGLELPDNLADCVTTSTKGTEVDWDAMAKTLGYKIGYTGEEEGYVALYNPVRINLMEIFPSDIQDLLDAAEEGDNENLQRVKEEFPDFWKWLEEQGYDPDGGDERNQRASESNDDKFKNESEKQKDDLDKKLKEIDKEMEAALKKAREQALKEWEKYCKRHPNADDGFPSDTSLYTDDDVDKAIEAMNNAPGGNTTGEIPWVDPTAVPKIQDTPEFNESDVNAIIKDWPSDRTKWTQGMKDFVKQLKKKVASDPEFAETLADMIDAGVFDEDDPADVTRNIIAYINDCQKVGEDEVADYVTIYTIADADYRTTKKDACTQNVNGNPYYEIKCLERDESVDDVVLRGNANASGVSAFLWSAGPVLGRYSYASYYESYRVSYTITVADVQFSQYAVYMGASDKRTPIRSYNATVVLEDESGIKTDNMRTVPAPYSGTITVTSGSIDMDKRDFFDTKRLNTNK